MRGIRPLSVAATLAVILLAAPQTARAQDAKAEVTAASEKFEAAYNARNAATLTSLYAETAIVMPPGSEPLKGREAIRTMWESLDETAPKLDLKTKDVIVAGDLAIETGGWSGTNADGSHADHGSYLAAWKKTDGGWKMIRDTWNSSMNQ